MTDAAATDTAPRPASAAPPPPEAAFERLEIGDRFLLLSGWVTAPAPHRLILGDAAEIPLNGTFPRPDPASDAAEETQGFVIDLPRPAGPLEAMTIGLRSLARGLITVPLGGLPSRAFQPRGHLDHVSPDRLAGWIFNPALWHGPADQAAIELLIDGQHRVPLSLNCQRPDLPVSAAQAGRLLGFELGLREVAELMAQAQVRRELLGGEHDYALLTGGIQVGGLRRGRGRVILRSQRAGTAAPAAPKPSPAAPAPSPTEPAGYIDYYGHIPALGGWIFGGWVRGELLAEVTECPATASFEAGALTAQAMTGRHPRQDIAGLGQGFVAFLPGDPVPAAEDATLGALKGLTFEIGGARQLSPSLGAILPEPTELIGMVRALLATAEGGLAKPTPLHRLLSRPVFDGVETVSRLSTPVHLEIDTLLFAPDRGLAMIGWFLDPTRSVKSIRARVGGRLSVPLTTRWIATERADIRDAFAGRYALDHARWGFVTFVEAPTAELRNAHLEIELQDGAIAFYPLPPPAEGGVAAIRRLLNGLDLAADEVVALCSRVLGPPTVALNRARLAAAGTPTEVMVGEPPERPRCSVIIPLYGRIDYLMYQCALFSEYGLPADELIYVLDDPPKRAELIALARSAYRRFGIPLRLVLLPQNLGYAPANNAGLAVARGEFICFLNSDVMPRDGQWLDRLTGALRDDPTLGVTGGLLLFEDGTVQHDGMAFERLPQLGNWPFPMHPGKGRIRGPARGLHREPAITGACMVLRRDLAQRLGGFDTDYVIGDFEDADLCFRIRAEGLDCAVDDAAVLWHLERQSQGLPGNSWRFNLTLVNAWTFAERWSGMIPGATPAGGDPAVLRLS
ncbi:hypothetical protein GCM10011504_20520 [Siccirubricoccus deserti]|uniref:Glycosyltransferase family 2 protein n=1 Tax=Siccirubricoccus deserti TaxID=2013562 RepID=A0A9X0QY83_9PROT|nr:glycosyltransferase family 2 protein [Siccirubricoccus deserti]MBC4015473.1 glycosyltransferase family 2 protein [Siccirubricoccus deserti]GGC41985.1 hypothetical protein GCM10011504_20520 [Siccirubricoccus deserti]